MYVKKIASLSPYPQTIGTMIEMGTWRNGMKICKNHEPSESSYWFNFQNR